MNPLSAKALVNGSGRPLTTSKLNPYVMKKLPDTGEIRVAPRIAALKKVIRRGATFTRTAHANWQEAKANYVPGTHAEGRQHTAEARQAAADMVRRYRKTGYLSAIARLTNLNARLTEFAE